MILCYIVWPLAVIPIKPFFPKRARFERKNFQDSKTAFAEKAHLAFAICSDGELEQIYPLLEKLLKEKKRIELTYSLTTVEHSIEFLKEKYPKLFRAFRLPLITSAPWLKQSALNFLTAPTLIICRATFWPENLLYGIHKAKKFILINAYINKHSGFFERLFYRLLFPLFDQIIPCSMREKKKLEKLLGKTVQDELYLRVLRIQNRFSALENTVRERGINHYINLIQKWPAKNRLLLAQIYPSDMAILNHPSLLEKIKSKQLLICICPRNILNGKTLFEKWTGQFPAHPHFSIIDNHNLQTLSLESFPNFHLFNIHGLLCELYPFFPISYIGGGFQHSLHSVLEPYLGDSQAIICNPKTSYHVELDLLLDWDAENIHPIGSHEEFYHTYEKIRKHTYQNTPKGNFINHNKAFIDIMKRRCMELERELLGSDSR